MIVQKEHAESCKCASDDLLGSRRVRPLGKKGKGFAEKLKDLRRKSGWNSQPDKLMATGRRGIQTNGFS